MTNHLQKIVSAILALAICFGCVAAVAEGEEWICPACGAVNSGNFCTKCGEKKPEEIVCPDCGEIYAVDSGAVFCGNCGAKLQESRAFIGRYEGSGFATPEEAVTCYMEGFKNRDFDQILAAFAWETQIERMSFQKYYERIRAYTPSAHPRMPSADAFMASANVNALRYYQVTMIYRALENYILGEEAPNGKVITLNSPEEVTAFLQKFDNGRIENLSEMTNIRFITPDEITGGKFSMEINLENFGKQTAYYCADEAVNLIGVANVGDEMFYCCPTVVRYGDRWYLASVGSFTSMIMGVSMDKQAFVCGKGGLVDLIR